MKKMKHYMEDCKTIEIKINKDFSNISWTNYPFEHKPQMYEKCSQILYLANVEKKYRDKLFLKISQ